jgi:hypothetical protein
MQILLDHILKKLKIKTKIALLLGLSIFLLSCNVSEFKLQDTYTQISEIKTFNLPESTNKNDINKFQLKSNFANLVLANKFSDSNIIIFKYILKSPNQDLSWDINPIKIEINNSQYIGANNINLASNYFEEGTYSLQIISKDGREINTTINLENNLNGNDEPNIFLSENSIVLSDEDSFLKDEKFESNQNINSRNIEVSFYDREKKLLNTEYFNNFIIEKKYPFEIKIENLETVFFIKIQYKKANDSDIEYRIDLSSTHSLL